MSGDWRATESGAFHVVSSPVARTARAAAVRENCRLIRLSFAVGCRAGGQAGRLHKIRRKGITALGRAYGDTCAFGRVPPDRRSFGRQDGMYPKQLHFIH
ncbi:hypothetical protein GCM10010519_15590 [Streptomyces lactacystinicus]